MFQPDPDFIPMTIEGWVEEELHVIEIPYRRYSVCLTRSESNLLHRLSREFVDNNYRVESDLRLRVREQLRILLKKKYGEGAMEYMERELGAEFKLVINDRSPLRIGENTFVGYMDLSGDDLVAVENYKA